MSYIPPSTNLTVTQISAAYTVLATDQYIEATLATANYAVTLPASTGSGQTFTFKKLGSPSHKLTITPAGTDTIDGANSLVAKANDTSYTIIDAAVGVWEII